MATSNNAREAWYAARRRAADRRDVPRASTARLRGLAICLAAAIAPVPAWAEPCAAPTPACHLENGKELLTADPRRAAEELLASYQLDERTDTLALYAMALALDQRHALALDTWKRVIVFRDSELDAAKEAARTAAGRKRAAARAAAARAQKQSEQAAEAIIALWSRVGRVRIRSAAGAQLAVTRDGAPVDPAQDVVVNAGGDELVFTHRDGSTERVAVQVAAGAFAKIDAPAEPVGKPAAPVEASAARAPGSRKPEAAARPVTPGKPAASVAASAAAPVEVSAATRPAATRPAVPVAASAAPVAAPPSVPTPRVAVERAAEPSGEPSTDRAADKPRSLAMSRVGLGAIAGGIVAGGVAGSFGYLASRDRDRSQMAGCSADGRCPFGPAADLALQANSRARIAQISAIGAGALVATGVTLWLIGRGKTRGAATDVALHVDPLLTAPSGSKPAASLAGLSAAISGRFWP